MIDASEFLLVLGNGLWHTTSDARYRGILKTGYILPEPDIPDSERWNTSGGPRHYPYARSLGGISLFDFEGFNSESYCKKYPLSSWQEFIPYRREWGSAIWLEISRLKIADSFVSRVELLDRWRSEANKGRNFLPALEAVHIGPIPIAFISRALAVDTIGYEAI